MADSAKFDAQLEAVLEATSIKDDLAAAVTLEPPSLWPIFEPKTDQQLKDALWHGLGIVIPDVPVCAQGGGPNQNHVTPFKVFADAFFARHGVIVVKASRGLGGKSMFMAVLAIMEAVFLGAEVNILAGSGEQAQRILDNMSTVWDRPQAQPLRQILGFKDIGRRKTQLITGGKVSALMASQKSVRGPHPHRLRIDEADEMDIKLLDAAMGQPMPKYSAALNRILESNTLIASTQQYWDRTMSELIRRSVVENKYAFGEWCWRETVRSKANPLGWLDPETVREKRGGVTNSMWDAEYEGQEPNPESRAIMPARVVQMFQKEIGYHVGEMGEYNIEPMNAAGKPDHRGVFTHGADWAKVQDATVIVTIRWDCKPIKIVAYRRVKRQDYPIMVSYLDQRLALFEGRSAHDMTGVGVAVDDMITFRNPKPEGVTLNGAIRQQVFGDYIAAIEKGEIVAPFIAQMEKEHRLCSVDDLQGSGHPPDTFVAAALAYYAGFRRVRLAWASA